VRGGDGMFGVIDKSTYIDDEVRQEWMLRQFKEHSFSKALLVINKYNTEKEKMKEYDRDKLNRNVYTYQPINRKFKGT
jgi:hypothetical protein